MDYSTQCCVTCSVIQVNDLWKECRGGPHMTAGESARLYPAMPSSRYRSSIGSGERSRPMISVESIEDSGDAPNPIIRRVVDWIACSTDTIHQRIRNFRARADIEPLLVANRHRRTISPTPALLARALRQHYIRNSNEGRATISQRVSAVAKQPLDDVERKIGSVPPVLPRTACTIPTNLKRSSSPSSRARGRAAPVLRLHPNLAELYCSKTATLVEALDELDAVSEAGEILRSLIKRAQKRKRRTQGGSGATVAGCGGRI